MLCRALSVTALLLALPAGASAAPVKWFRAGACPVLADKAGDVRAVGVAGSEAIADKHLDVESVYVFSRGKTVDVTIYDARWTRGAAGRGS